MRRSALLGLLLPLTLTTAADPPAHCKTARIVSEGWQNLSHIGKAEFYLDDEKIPFETGRGLNIVVLDPGTQEVLSTNTYDTWMHQDPENIRLIEDLSVISPGQIVLVSVKDDGMELLSHAAQDQLRSIGATNLRHTFRQSYALIGSKGGRAMAEKSTKGAHELEISGKLPCKECIRAAVVSNNAPNDEPAKFYLNGEAWDAPAGDGLNVLLVDRVTQKPVDFKRYVPNSHKNANAMTSTGASFAADIHLLPEGTIILVAAWPASHSLVDDSGRMALQWLGAEASRDSFNGGSYAFIGSKMGWAISETSNKTGRAIAQGRLPCVLKDTTPRELPYPQAAFPGMSATQSNAAWPSGRQPKPFEAWPKSVAGRLEPCWKTHVVRNYESRTLGGCHNLTPTSENSTEFCRSSCGSRPDCSVWRWSRHNGCLQGSSMNCNYYGEEGELPPASEQLQHGDVLVLKPLLAVQVLGLRHLSKPGKRTFESVARCRDWCYANINCQFWQYGENGCHVEDPQNGAVAQYPLTLKGGAKVYSNVARTMLAGEYIQHFCPPKPLGFRNKSRELDYEAGAAFKWNGSLVLGRRGNSRWAPWDTGRALPKWPQDKKGRMLPCSKSKVLEQHTLPSGEWEKSCLRRIEEKDLEGASCRDMCLFNTNCTFWAVTGTVGREACYHSTGEDCLSSSSDSVQHWNPKEEWIGQRIQHGEVEVMKDIAKVEIYNLFNLGKCKEGNEEECAQRCKAWCYSNTLCRYWQYGTDGCLVDPIGEGAPAYAFGLEGALSLSKTGHRQEHGEYIRHICRSQDVLRDVHNVGEFMKRVDSEPKSIFGAIGNGIKGFFWHIGQFFASIGRGIAWLFSSIWWAIKSFFGAIGRAIASAFSAVYNFIQGLSLPWRIALLVLALLGLLLCCLPLLMRFFPKGARTMRSQSKVEPTHQKSAWSHRSATSQNSHRSTWSHEDKHRGDISSHRSQSSWLKNTPNQSKQSYKSSATDSNRSLSGRHGNTNAYGNRSASGVGAWFGKGKQRGGARESKFRWCGNKDPYAYSLCPCINECSSGGAWNPIDPKRICVVLEKAPLEFATAQAQGKQEHAPEDLLTTFHCLQALQDSALAKAGKLQVFMHSPRHLVEVHPNLLPPATFTEFKRYITTVLTEGEVHGEPRDFQPECMLMRTLPPPVKRHLLRNSSCHAISASGRRTTLDQVAQRDIAAKKNMVFVLGMSSTSDAVREAGYGADYAPDVVDLCPFIVSKGQVCRVLCQSLLPYVGVHDPPLEQDYAGRLLNLDARYTDGPEPLSRPMNEPLVEPYTEEP